MQKAENCCSVGAVEVVFWLGTMLFKLYLGMQLYYSDTAQPRANSSDNEIVWRICCNGIGSVGSIGTVCSSLGQPVMKIQLKTFICLVIFLAVDIFYMCICVHITVLLQFTSLFLNIWQCISPQNVTIFSEQREIKETCTRTLLSLHLLLWIPQKIAYRE
jgi:hypothetical protein